MGMTPKLWSVNGLCTELGINRPKLAKLIAGLKKAGSEKGGDLYLMADVVERLMGRGGDTLDHVQEDARHKRAQADLKELELAKRRGELVDIETVAATLEGVVTRVRAKLLGIPKKAAVLIVGEKRPAAIQDKMTGLVYEALEDLASIQPESKPRQRGKQKKEGADSQEGPAAQA